jgi:hypothetical protein
MAFLRMLVIDRPPGTDTALPSAIAAGQLMHPAGMTFSNSPVDKILTSSLYAGYTLTDCEPFSVDVFIQAMLSLKDKYLSRCLLHHTSQGSATPNNDSFPDRKL